MHLLVVGLEQLTPFSRGLAYEDLIEWTRDMGRLTILTQSAVGIFKLCRWMNAKSDPIKVLNASYPFRFFTRRGLGLAERLSLSGVDGCDAHHPRTVDDAYIIIKVNKPAIKDVIEQ